MSLPLCVLPSPKTCTSSSRMARTMAVVVTARPERRGVEVLLAAHPEVERAALDGRDALAHHRVAAVHQAGRHAAVLQRHRRDVVHVGLVRLGEVRRVGVHREALMGEPGDGAARVEPAREGDAQFGARRRKRSVDAAHDGAAR
jgi:hypothetical protein